MVVSNTRLPLKRHTDCAGRQELFKRDRVASVPVAPSCSTGKVVSRTPSTEIKGDRVWRREPSARQSAINVECLRKNIMLMINMLIGVRARPSNSGAIS